MLLREYLCCPQIGTEGIASGRPAAEWAAQAALGSAMAEAAPAVFGAVLAALEALTDRRDHDALSPDDIKIFQTPLGACLLIPRA